MKITIGQDGLKNSWQREFPPEIKCSHEGCDGMARPALNIIEEAGDKEPVVHLHNNEGGTGGDFWLHDLAAFQIYLCRTCLKPTTLGNQA